MYDLQKSSPEKLLNGTVKYCIQMVHALSNSGYSVNVEIVTIMGVRSVRKGG